MSQKRVLVILAGCGYLDGAEINEAVLSLLALDRAGVRYQCAAPDKNQYHVVNHLTQEPTTETRNVLVEAARIARSKIVALSTVQVDDYDVLFMPGGFGAAKNLSTVAIDGPAATVDPEVLRVIRGFRAANKPIGAVCIAPAVLVAALREGEVTIGRDPGTAAAIQTMGGKHVVCEVTGIHVDTARKLVTTPAYMYNARLSEAATGIEKAVTAVLALS